MVVRFLCHGMAARSFINVVVDKEVCDLSGNACALVVVLGSDHPHASAVVLPFGEDASVHQGGALRIQGFIGSRTKGSGGAGSMANPDGGMRGVTSPRI